jgi:hypothetical protein
LAYHVIGTGREGGKLSICPLPREREKKVYRILIPKMKIIF